MTTFSVPSKVHLLGEHAVVYGKPALLSAIDKRVLITISSSRKKQIEGAEGYKVETKKLIEILERETRRRTRIKAIKPYTLRIKSQVPIGAGLGSSAALSAGITACLLSFLKIPWDKETIFDIAYKGEKYFHGNPSGGDLAAVITGGFLWFRKEFEFLKTFSPLPFKPHKNIKQFILINSGKPKETTKEMVAKVSQFKSAFTKKTQELFNSQEELTKKMVISLKYGDENTLMECIRLGERNLEKLGVVGRKTQDLIRTIEKLGGAAKISGGGGVKKGSGMILCYHKDMKSLLTYVKQKKLEVVLIHVGTEGLKRYE